ncbi:hypothetical protein FRB94_006822 [Tulasnella sp. JGI-2019a]|nr:hypothetical protein FRB93_010365 [Tulasnella sp. JGI-2019a]KAG9012022.1 hypothetical protein FRB94_006822 [Tulasnella sp. JGI-2019a]KAG9030660.1 hypothetical protein FRB95_003675 [Tulasnella sp. JGI-2019a]
MLRPTSTLLAPLALILYLSTGAYAQTTCGVGSPCGAAAPCCSEYGFCGSGETCLGGCNPLYSHSVTSCVPEPICANESVTFPDLSRILTNTTTYDGNATLHDFVVDKGEVFLSDANELVLTLTQTNNGTRMSSTRYVHYGTITATMKTARSNGVVNAFITMSDVKDEIDWEWPGSSTTSAQTNYFWLGFINATANHGTTESGIDDTFGTFHDYTIDWQPDALTWSIDGKAVRTLQKTDTLSSDGTYYEYPTTPARVQFSIWPAGIASEPAGTVAWAGGMIDWSDPDYVAQGHFSTIIKSVTIKCSAETTTTSANNGTLPANSQSYVYTTNDTNSGLIPRVMVSNLSTNVNAAGPAFSGVGLGGAAVLISAAAGVLAVSAFFV